MGGVAEDHVEIFVLAAAMEAEPQAEAVRQRDLLFDCFPRIDRCRALVLDHLARQEMPPVRGGVEDAILRPAFDAALQHRLQRLVGRIIAVEGQIIAEHDEVE